MRDRAGLLTTLLSTTNTGKLNELFCMNTMDNFEAIGSPGLSCFFVDTEMFRTHSEKNVGYKTISQAGISIAGRNIISLRYANNTTLMAEREEDLKSLLMTVKVESEKVGLKLNIWKSKIMESGPITSWQLDGETMKTVRDFILGGSKITADGDCSHEIKRPLLLGRKAMINLDSILKSRDIILPTKVYLVKTMFFPVIMYSQKIDAFKLSCWRRLLRVLWTARR